MPLGERTLQHLPGSEFFRDSEEEDEEEGSPPSRNGKKTEPVTVTRSVVFDNSQATALSCDSVLTQEYKKKLEQVRETARVCILSYKVSSRQYGKDV